MKFLLLPLLLCCHLAFSQSYNELLEQAVGNLNKKDYCAALSNFKAAFSKGATIGAYDYISGVTAAANCNDPRLALEWLKKSYALGLGKNQEEVTYLETNEVFKNISHTKDFQSILMEMKARLGEKGKEQREAAEEWNKTIVAHRVLAQVPFQKAPKGFVLYFREVEGMQVPYLVYVPKGYKPSQPATAIVFLHGGVVSSKDFFHNSPQVKNEPIFSIGEQFNSIIIYPFGKKDFGWVDQEKAFENVLAIVAEVTQKYSIDTSRIYLGGMSNGGSATFWFAAQQTTLFRAFYAFAANPVLKIGTINFGNITSNHPLYTIHSKQDEIFGYDNVIQIYNEHKAQATGWTFETIEKGAHGFIYDPAIGPKLLRTFFATLLK